jgi:hypothetical protein
MGKDKISLLVLHAILVLGGLLEKGAWHQTLCPRLIISPRNGTDLAGAILCVCERERERERARGARPFRLWRRREGNLI